MTGRTRIRRRAGVRRWRQDPEGRKARILKAAQREFARRGYRRARVDAIARSARVAEGSVYHWFSSKRGLLVAVGEAYGRGLAEAAFAGLGADFHPRDVGAVVENIFRYVAASEAPLTVFLLTNAPEEGAPAQDANRETMLRAIEATLSRWMRQGAIPESDPRVAAELQFGLVESALRDCVLRGGGAERDLYVREATRCLAACLGQTPRP